MDQFSLCSIILLCMLINGRKRRKYYAVCVILYIYIYTGFLYLLQIYYIIHQFVNKYLNIIQIDKCERLVSSPFTTKFTNTI